MNMFKPVDPNRRSFLRNAGLLSLSFSFPGLTGKHPKITGNSADSVIEIHTGNKITVLINVFTMLPENEQKLIDLLEEGTLSIFGKQPGFISESINRGSDGKRLVLYGQWEGPQYIEAFRQKPEVKQYGQKLMQLATAVESIICNDVPFVHHK